MFSYKTSNKVNLIRQIYEVYYYNKYPRFSMTEGNNQIRDGALVYIYNWLTGCQQAKKKVQLLYIKTLRNNIYGNKN